MKARLVRLAHLVARFADVSLAKRLAPGEQAAVAGYLVSDAERSMFWDQPRADQRHGLEAACWVAAERPDRRDLIRAALLHDTGKRHAWLGPVARCWAAVRSAMGLAVSDRVASYLDHGRQAGRELSAAGADPLAVAYARYHHGERPDAIAPDDWRVLQGADRPFLRRRSATHRPLPIPGPNRPAAYHVVPVPDGDHRR